MYSCCLEFITQAAFPSHWFKSCQQAREAARLKIEHRNARAPEKAAWEEQSGQAGNLNRNGTKEWASAGRRWRARHPPSVTLMARGPLRRRSAFLDHQTSCVPRERRPPGRPVYGLYCGESGTAHERGTAENCVGCSAVPTRTTASYILTDAHDLSFPCL